MLYTAESLALAMAEVLVHLSLVALPDDYMMIEIEIPDYIQIGLLDLSRLDENWNLNPLDLQTQELGDAFIRLKETCVLKVPSAVVKGDFNYLLNPKHPEIEQIRIKSITEFPFDQRVFK